MAAKQKVTRFFGVVCTAALVVAVAAGCANPLETLAKKGAEQVGEKVVGELAGADIDIGTTSKVPADFPSDVPLPNGTLGAAVSSEQDTTLWILHYVVKDGNAEFDDYRAVITAQGFVEVTWSDFGGMKIGGFENDAYSVSTSLLGIDDEDIVMQVMVTEK